MDIHLKDKITDKILSKLKGAILYNSDQKENSSIFSQIFKQEIEVITEYRIDNFNHKKN